MRRKIASYVLVASLLFPLGLSLVHALHEHENEICLVESESHIHKETIDCDALHFLSQSASDSNFEEQETPLDFSFIEANFYFFEAPCFELNYATTGRAPPVFKIV